MSGVVIEELDSSDDDFGTPTSKATTGDGEGGFHSPGGSQRDMQESYQTTVNAGARHESAAGSSGGAVQGEVASGSCANKASLTAARTEQVADPGGAAAEGSELTLAEQKSLEEAEVLKAEGNELYKGGQFLEALEKYERAIDTAPERAAPQRAVFFANSAAVRLKLEEWAAAAKECSAALELEPHAALQLKVLGRRSIAYEKLDDLDRALADHEKVLTLDEGNASSRAAVDRLKPIVEERREKMKEEMLGKLKDLGNTVLGKFGMSLDNFKAEKDPETGSYSINFKQ